MPVGEMLTRMDSREITEWQCYCQLEEERWKESELARKSETAVRSRKGAKRR